MCLHPPSCTCHYTPGRALCSTACAGRPYSLTLYQYYPPYVISIYHHAHLHGRTCPVHIIYIYTTYTYIHIPIHLPCTLFFFSPLIPRSVRRRRRRRPLVSLSSLDFSVSRYQFCSCSVSRLADQAGGSGRAFFLFARSVLYFLCCTFCAVLYCADALHRWYRVARLFLCLNSSVEGRGGEEGVEERARRERRSSSKLERKKNDSRLT